MKTNPGDIIVTTPKSESERSAEEAQELIAAGDGHYFHSVPSRPKLAQPGNRIFYVDKSFIRGFATIVDIVSDRQTPRYPHDRNIFRHLIKSDATTWTWIQPIEMRGFQGFRYADFEFEVVGGWLDPMPQMSIQLP